MFSDIADTISFNSFLLSSDATVTARNEPQIVAADLAERNGRYPRKPLAACAALAPSLFASCMPCRAHPCIKVPPGQALFQPRMAKLSGLSHREVGRCKCALGNALEWWLWVGKVAVPSEESSRGIARTRSECSTRSRRRLHARPRFRRSPPLRCRMAAQVFPPLQCGRIVHFH